MNRELGHLQKSRFSSRQLACCLLAMLAWSQLSFAAHQFDHSMVDTGETCTICLQLERDDDALLDVVDAGLPLAVPESIDGTAPVAIRTERFSPFASRASP